MKPAQQLMRHARLVRSVFDHSRKGAIGCRRLLQRIISGEAHTNRNRHAVPVQSRRQPRGTHRVIAVVMAHVFFTRPQHFHRPAIQALCNNHRLMQFAMHSAAAKTAAFKTVVHEYAVCR